jgi:hypothetical protein
MNGKKVLAIAVAAASGVAYAGSLGTTSAQAPIIPDYSSQALVANGEVPVGTTAFLTTTRPTTLQANSVLTLNYGKTLLNSAGTAFSAPAELEIDYRSYLPTGSAPTFVTNATLTLAGSGTNPLRYILLSGGLPDFVQENTAGGTVDRSSFAIGLTGAVSLPGSLYVTSTGLAGVTLAASLENADGVEIESASGSLLTVGGSQMSGGALSANATIDVDSLKTAFDTGLDNTTLTLAYNADTLTGSAGATTIVDSTVATNGTVAVVITGQDWSWLDTDADTAGIQVDGTVITGLTSPIVTNTTITGTAAVNSSPISVVLTNAEDVAIPVQTGITASVRKYFTKDDATESFTALNMTGTGVWQLNGSSIDVYAVPNSDNVSVFMWLTNTGTGSVPIDATLYDNGTECAMENIATSVAGTELDLTAALSAAVEAQCPTYVPSGNRVRYNVSANAPANSIRISAAYRVGTDRVNLVTSSEANL